MSALTAFVSTLLVYTEWAVLAYFLAVNSFYAVQLTCAAFEARRHSLMSWEENRERVLGSDLAPTISVLAPAYNEGATVAESVRALVTLQYPNLEVVLINDGSTDDTMEVLQSEFELKSVHPIYQQLVSSQPIVGLYRSRVKPGLVVVDKVNGGKADALNAGLNVATGELVCAIDADTLIEPDGLLRMVRPFLLANDVLASGGTIRVANGSTVRGGRVVATRAPRSFLAGVQAVEYLRAFLFGRLGWNRLGGNLIISGAFGLFRREAVMAAGGYVHETVGEDMELVAHLRRRALEHDEPDRVLFVPDPVAWTEVPESLRALGRQRDRWQRGLADVMWRHRVVLLNLRYGTLGMVVFPFFFFVELLGPVLEAVGLLGLVAGLALGSISPGFAVLFFLVAYGYVLALTMLTLLLEELVFHRYEGLVDRLVMLVWALLESLGYRQLTVLWRLRGLWKFVRKDTGWGAMQRRGFAGAQSASNPPDAS